jgi:hypothetical protein
MAEIEPFILGLKKIGNAVKSAVSKAAIVVKGATTTTTTTIPITTTSTTIPVTTTSTTIDPNSTTIDPNSTTIDSNSTTTTIPANTKTTISATTTTSTIPANANTTISTTTTTTVPVTTTTTTTVPATTTTKSNTNNVSNYCYRDINSNKIVCDYSVGLIDYTFKNPSSYVLNLSASQVISNNKIITPIFQSQDEQTRYCTLVCSRNDTCQGFKSTYDTSSNSYYCDFYKPNINIKNVLQPGQESTSQKTQVQAACSRTSNYAYV